MSRKIRRRSTTKPREQDLVILPHVLVSVAESGVLEVRLDGAPYPPSEGTSWTRAEFGNLLDAITQDRTVPMRVEVHESDGTVFTDLIRPRRRTATRTPQTAAVGPRGKHAKDKLRPGSVEVTADGFVPGEDVAVAVVLTHARASSIGTVSVPMDQTDRSMVTGSPVEVVLYGQASGLVQVRRLS